MAFRRVRRHPPPSCGCFVLHVRGHASTCRGSPLRSRPRQCADEPQVDCDYYPPTTPSPACVRMNHRHRPDLGDSAAIHRLRADGLAIVPVLPPPPPTCGCPTMQPAPDIVFVLSPAYVRMIHAAVQGRSIVPLPRPRADALGSLSNTPFDVNHPPPTCGCTMRAAEQHAPQFHSTAHARMILGWLV